MNWKAEVDFARQLAREAGQLALEYQRRGVTPENKADDSPVTIADKETEKFLARRIAERFPGDGLLGEEGASGEARSGRRWILDPIDGTRDFVRGTDVWSVLIALEDPQGVVAGFCYLPVRDELYWAVRGGGAWLGDSTRLRVSSIDSLSQASLGLNGLNNSELLPFAPKLLDWTRRCWSVRAFGGCFDAALLASGKIDIYVEATAKTWDLSPLKVIIEEAGGRFWNFDGGSRPDGGNCIAFTPGLEPAIRELLNL